MCFYSRMLMDNDKSRLASTTSHIQSFILRCLHSMLVGFTQVPRNCDSSVKYHRHRKQFVTRMGIIGFFFINFVRRLFCQTGTVKRSQVANFWYSKVHRNAGNSTEGNAPGLGALGVFFSLKILHLHLN